MEFLPSSYDAMGVAASVAIAFLASYVALDLARRVRTPNRKAALVWWAMGSVAMGTGIWSMHFIGMLAFSLPITLGYTIGLTVLSWLAAVATSGVALYLASRGRLTWQRLLGGALVMGAGICAMHYIGMAALDMAPGIVWNAPLVAASAVIAVGASAAALAIFFWLRGVAPEHATRWQLLAAGVMGVAISGMHYTGMAAAGFAQGSVCLSADALGGQGMVGLITVGGGVVLLLTLLSSFIDARLRRVTQRMEVSLQQANAQLQEANEELRQRAFIDPLTGLPNRLLFEDRLRHALSRSERMDGRTDERRAERLAVMFIDLDRFKPINDSFGHAAGDEVLKEAARRLRDVARDSDTVARVGGDEFLLLMEDAGSVADSVALARRVVTAFSEPFRVAGKSVQVPASVGIAVHPGHGHRDKLVSNADAAMYVAKRAGSGTYALFEAHMGAQVEAQVTMQSELRLAIEVGQLELHYQPKFDSKRGGIRGVEALVRWNHPQRGMIAPADFIPLAERCGLIASLGHWVIEECCRQMAAWQQRGMRMRVAINISVHQLREEDLVQRIHSALTRHGVDPAALLCEITESVAMEDIRATQRAFDGLAKIGVFLSIDDFGTGYSSLSYLRQLPARQLKVDRSFVQDLETSADARAIVDAVIRLAHALGLVVVAEGVETKEQGDILMAMGCDELQGFYFARPLSAGSLLQWAQGDKPDGAVDFTPSVIGAPLPGN
jgi:diguanylate cyclase (GGDEF)-like protein